LKPAAVIESVDLKVWESFRQLLESLDLYYIYRGRRYYVLVSKEEVSVERIKIEKMGLTLSTLRPELRYGIEVSDVLVARRLDDLLRLYELYVLRTLTGVERVLELGRVLGYPHCCVRAFAEYNDPAEARHRFHQQLIKLGLDKGSPIELWAVYHTPCSVNCSRTLTLGRGYLRAVEEFSSKVYRRVVEGLSGVHLTWSVGRRYLDYEILDSDVSREFSILASRVLGRGAMVRAVFVKRPYMYVDQVSESLVVRLTPAIMGLR